MVAGCKQSMWVSRNEENCDNFDRQAGKTTKPLLWTNSLPRKNKKNPGEFGFYERTESCYVRRI